MSSKVQQNLAKSNDAKAIKEEIDKLIKFLNPIKKATPKKLKEVKNRLKDISENISSKEKSMSEILISSNPEFFIDHQNAKNIIDDIGLIDNYLGINSLYINYSYDKRELLKNLSNSINTIKTLILKGDSAAHLVGSDVLHPLSSMHYYNAIKDAQMFSFENLSDAHFHSLEELRAFFLKIHTHKLENA